MAKENTKTEGMAERIIMIRKCRGEETANIGKNKKWQTNNRYKIDPMEGRSLDAEKK